MASGSIPMSQQADNRADGPIRIMLVSDYAAFRDGFRERLASEDGISLEAEADRFEAALSELVVVPLDVLVLEIDLSAAGALGQIQNLRRSVGSIPILVVSRGRGAAVVIQALVRHLVQGYLSKSVNLGGVLTAVRVVADGNVVFDRQALEIAFRPPPQLSERQQQVPQLTYEGLTRVQIAERLAMSDNGVDYHLRAILRTFNVHSARQAVRLAHELGLLSPPQIETFSR